MQKVPLAKLVLNFELYPRHDVDRTQVRRMAAAMEAGEELPPILADRDTLTVVDGFHRYYAARRVGGEGAEIAAVLHAYRDDAEMFLEAVRINARHGVPLEPMDAARAAVMAEELGIEPEKLAEALAMTPGHLELMKAGRIATGPDGLPMLLKRTISKVFAGRRLTKAQVAVNDRLVGMRAEYYLGRTVELIRHRLLDLKNERIRELLDELREALEKMQVPA